MADEQPWRSVALLDDDGKALDVCQFWAWSSGDEHDYGPLVLDHDCPLAASEVGARLLIGHGAYAFDGTVISRDDTGSRVSLMLAPFVAAPTEADEQGRVVITKPDGSTTTVPTGGQVTVTAAGVVTITVPTEAGK